MKNSLFLTVCILLLTSCSPKARINLVNTNYDELKPEVKLIVLNKQDSLLGNSEFMGDIKVGDSGFSTDCGYDVVMQTAKSTARKSGANIMLITEIKQPNMGSSCYRITAKLYRNFNEDFLIKLQKGENLKSRLPEDADYAIIHFYRPSYYLGAAIGYKIRIDDATIIGRMRNGEKFDYKTQNFGNHKFWGVTESQDSVVINIEKGKEYFVRCAIALGTLIGKPEIYLVDNYVGINEYENMK